MSGSLADLLHVVVVFSEVACLLWLTLLVAGLAQGSRHPIIVIVCGIPVVALMALVFLLG